MVKQCNYIKEEGINVDLGVFSVSLTVKDIDASKAFYEKLGFSAVGGQVEQNWLIMRNGDCVIGLFQGMFEKNILTFCPGWNIDQEEINPFTDVRELQEQLRAKGVTFIAEVAPDTEGPGSFIIQDPDGNPILIDQHR